MKKLIAIAMTAAVFAGCSSDKAGKLSTPNVEDFNYVVEQFADIQILRYRVAGIESLTLQQQELLYYLTEAALQGRDILFDQNGKYNLTIRQLLEAVYSSANVDKNSDDYKALELYLKRVWVSNGIHHHYAGDKFVPGFTQEFFVNSLQALPQEELPLGEGESFDELMAVILPVMFDPSVKPLHKNQAADADLLLTSASNYYEGVTQAEAEAFYNAMKDPNDLEPISYGLTSRLVKKDGIVQEEVYRVGGKYSDALEKVVYWLEKAAAVAENDQQREVIEKLIEFNKSGDLRTFDEYAICWIGDTASRIDFVNGFTETYGDPLGMKASWESLINFKDLEATKRTVIISDNAQWFEDNSPIANEYKKDEVKGVTAKVINAAMMGGDCYPTTPLGINLPNANWIRAAHGSKSVTIENVSEAYSQSVKGTGFNEEFVWGPEELEMLRKYKFLTDNLHTDLHECLGHGSGKLAPGVDPDALKNYGAPIEESRADLFGLYYMADPIMVELGLLPDEEAYKAQYYSYFMNGLMTQTTRIEFGKNIEQTHMRNRQLITSWVLEKGKEDSCVVLQQRDGKTYVVINNYELVRQHLGELLHEIQRIKSTGDFPAAQAMVEKYGIKIEPNLHREILDRYEALKMAPYKGFVNPIYTPYLDNNGTFNGLSIDYTEDYADQHLRYSRDYSPLTKK